MKSLLDFGTIFFYSAACAVYLPLPSEAPMFLFPEFSRLTVLLACAAGKGTGAYFVFITGSLLQQSKLYNKLLEILRLKAYWENFTNWILRIVQSYGLFGFFVFMSVPAMPMRTPIYAASVLKLRRLPFVLAVAVGTVVRNLLVYWGFLGIKSILR